MSNATAVPDLKGIKLMKFYNACKFYSGTYRVTSDSTSKNPRAPLKSSGIQFHITEQKNEAPYRELHFQIHLDDILGVLFGVFF